jgi:hypothetical protein
VTTDGVVTGRNVTVTSSGGGGGGGIVGPLLILGGVFMLWIVFKGKSGAMWNAITGNTGFDVTLNDVANAVNPYINNQGNSSQPSKSGAPVSANSMDSGTHMGIDSNGNIVTINSTYGDMTAAQKDAANAYAHQIGNIR